MAESAIVQIPNRFSNFRFCTFFLKNIKKNKFEIAKITPMNIMISKFKIFIVLFFLAHSPE